MHPNDDHQALASQLQIDVCMRHACLCAGAEVVAAGLATHLVHSTRLGQLEQRLAALPPSHTEQMTRLSDTICSLQASPRCAVLSLPFVPV